VRLFLDSSVLLAASGSERGASRQVIERAAGAGWVLITTPYVIDEVLANLSNLPPAATADWARVRPELALMDDVLTLDRIAVFQPAKDRPILFSALAWSDALLTLDRADFGELLGREFYGLAILTPRMFLERQDLS
jgi:predicted nucleic acid-binding protein